MNPVEFKDLAGLVGQEVGVSDWVEITQERVNQFAEATGDHQWIHVDVERAKAGPYGAPIAHGFLTLSLLPELAATAMCIDDVKMSINYGLNRVRFTGPVPAGSRVRGVLKLKAYEPIEGEAKPACIAETISVVYGA